MKSWMNWLLIFVPAALILRFWPALSNPTALFICSAIAIVPVAINSNGSERRAAKQQYPCLVKNPNDGDEYLDAINAALKAKAQLLRKKT